MEYIKLLLYITFLLVVIFMLVYDWIYLIRVRISKDKIGISTPHFIKSLLSLSIIVSTIALVFITVMIIKSSVLIDSSGFSLPNLPVTF